MERRRVRVADAICTRHAGRTPTFTRYRDACFQKTRALKTGCARAVVLQFVLNEHACVYSPTWRPQMQFLGAMLGLPLQWAI